MSEYLAQAEFETVRLTADFAERYVDEITELLDLNPQAEQTPAELLADDNGDSQMFNKWQHSLVVFDGEKQKPIAVIMAYEREAEGNTQYPKDTIYISNLAVAEDYQNQRVATGLLGHFINHNNAVGFQTLHGEINYSVQTDSSGTDNQQVIDLFEWFGFKPRETKSYADRTDVVLEKPVIKMFQGKEFGLTDEDIKELEYTHRLRIAEKENRIEYQIRMSALDSSRRLISLIGGGRKWDEILEDMKHIYDLGVDAEEQERDYTALLAQLLDEGQTPESVLEINPDDRPSFMDYELLLRKTEWGAKFIQQVTNDAFLTKYLVGS